MSNPSLFQLEQTIYVLPREDQLWLVERVIRHLRQQAATTQRAPDAFADQLRMMAADPEIQRELCDMNAEFLITETDGLEA
ncbi:hypothetical protein U27_03394 [Candidatus Vecturithrix granuli]|uniref:Uncharacterized protein n=1 Tax=Vecturithrix granuli TaxID=1499967 RepID=A0A081BVS7_VECG1|nr:hypothetical protein U27_03394 [Candidatus Vecturithrix granuli]